MGEESPGEEFGKNPQGRQKNPQGGGGEESPGEAKESPGEEVVEESWWKGGGEKKWRKDLLMKK